MTSAKARHESNAREVFQAMSDLVLNNQRRREVSEQTGISFGKMRALRRIAGRPMPMRELAALLVVDPPNLTTLIDDLEDAGLVERQPHPTDRRVKLVVATPDGAALAERANNILGRPPTGLMELSADELETLREILSRTRREPSR
jgi:DNA-binding MarR family transcriptional regulator